eukprot:scaffold12788_cov139-Skeletonema_dohrnii-CCMP3373.AAC.2
MTQDDSAIVRSLAAGYHLAEEIVRCVCVIAAHSRKGSEMGLLLYCVGKACFLHACFVCCVLIYYVVGLKGPPAEFQLIPEAL